MCYQSVPLPQYSGNSILNTKLTDTRITDYYLSNARFKNEVIILLKKVFPMAEYNANVRHSGSLSF